MKLFTNPILAFILIWAIVLYMYSLHLSGVLLKLDSATAMYILLVLAVLLISLFFVTFLFWKKSFKNNFYFEDKNTKSKIRILVFIWAIFSLLEIILFKGLPVFSFFGIYSIPYTEWGIPSLHGFLNAIIIIVSNYQLFYYYRTKKKVYLFYFFCCLIWPILLVTRQMLLSMLLQALIFTLIYKSVRLQTVIRIAVFFLVFIIVFGIIGDFRSGADSFMSLAQPTENYPEWLPSGFLWVYIYITTPINNINYNILKFSNFNFHPSLLYANIFPSFIRNYIIKSDQGVNYELVNENLNVSSFFINYLDAFGYYGSLFYFFIFGLIISFIYFKTKSRKSNISWVFVLTVIVHNIIFSVFVDFFMNLVFLFQMILHYKLSSSPNDQV